MRLTLDWDSNALKEMHLPAVRNRQPARENQTRLASFAGENPDTGKWELWQSSSHGVDGGEGWHYIEYGLSGGLETMRQLRTAYGDDALRTSLDGLRMQWGSPFVGVLYHMKNIKPREHRPYETKKRANLVARHWPDAEETTIKNDDGTLNYPKIIKLLADHEDFTSRAALFRRIQSRGSVSITTDPSKRGYDLANARRQPTRNEKKALRDYAESRGLGHYDGGEEIVPEELAAKPTRTTFHEYWEMPEIEMNTNSFGEDDDESEWFPVNIRTGTYGDVDEMTVKQMHDSIADHVVDTLSPGFYQEVDGKREWQGLDLDRWDRAISLERNRRLDPDEKARYRRIVWENQPGTTKEKVHERVERKGISDPFEGDAVFFEVIVYDGEDAFKASGGTNYWWIARGVVDASDPDAINAPIRNAAIIADTEGWL